LIRISARQTPTGPAVGSGIVSSCVELAVELAVELTVKTHLDFVLNGLDNELRVDGEVDASNLFIVDHLRFEMACTRHTYSSSVRDCRRRAWKRKRPPGRWAGAAFLQSRRSSAGGRGASFSSCLDVSMHMNFLKSLDVTKRPNGSRIDVDFCHYTIA